MKTMLLFVWIFASTLVSTAQTYRPVQGWPKNVNDKLESFLNSTIIIKERKVAVFDCDGTLLGQAPYYLADEAIYAFAKERYANRPDSLSKAKMGIIDAMLHGDNTGIGYVKNRINFLSGLTPADVERMGEDCFEDKYIDKFYPEMRELLANLQAYGFEVWVVSASPEVLYQQFVHKALGIPLDRILGVRSVVQYNHITSEIVQPVPQEQGKADLIETVIKAKPLFAAGNSRGDMEMIESSVGLKMIVNPDDQKVEKNGFTVKGYWEKHNGIAVYCNDVPEHDYKYVTQDWGIPKNKTNKKN